MNEQQELDKSEEEKRFVLIAAKILKNKIKNLEISVNSYPTLEDITDVDQSHIPHILKIFISKMIKNPLKQE